MDFNALSCLMQALMQNQNVQKDKHASSTCANNTQCKNNSFAEQNGLGESVKIQFADAQEPKPQNKLFELLSGFSDKNPMLGLLGAMSSGDMSAALPLVMSLMQKQPDSSQGQAKPDSRNADTKSDSTSSGDMSANSAKKEEIKEKTQGALFSPVAFAGYEILSALCALLKAKRHPCK